MPADLYDVLGAADDAGAEEIKRAYRDRVREYHPDVNDHPDSDAQFKLIRTANDVLSNPAERKTYDRLGHREYAEKNLDDLPPISVFPDEDLPDDVSADDSGSGVDATTSSTTTGGVSTASPSTSSSTSSSTGRSSTSRSSTGADSRTERSSGGQGGYGSTGTSGDGSSSTASTAGGASASTTTANQSSGDSSSSGSNASSWDAATSSAQSATSSSSTVPEGVRRRRGLKRWYGVVALSLLGYLAGLGLYARPRQAALRDALVDALAAPVATLIGTFPLSSPTAYLLSAARAAQAGTPTLGLVLLAGTVLLPLVVLTTVGRFGRGAAWTYALPSLGPAITLAVWPVVAVPTAAALVGLVVLPILSGGGFLVDVGRYLRATR